MRQKDTNVAEYDANRRDLHAASAQAYQSTIALRSLAESLSVCLSVCVDVQVTSDVIAAEWFDKVAAAAAAGADVVVRYFSPSTYR